MKKIINAFIMLSIAFFTTNCTNMIDDDNREIGTYSKVIETVDFVLPAGDRWEYTIPNGKGYGVSLINSQEELLKYISGEGNDISPIDFGKHTLLLVYGDTISSIHTLTHQLVQIAEEEYRLDVELKTGADILIEGWTISVLIDKIPQNTTIQLKVNSSDTGKPANIENPYMDDITGAWKLLHCTTVTDTIDSSKDNVIYDFRVDGKLVVTGSTSGDFTDGEYTYEYKKLNICRTCPPISNLRIGNDDNLFCEAYAHNNTMTMSVKKTEQGETFMFNYYLIKVREREPDDNKGPSDPKATLVGTKWKLAGIGDTKTGILTELEPKDCKDCYTLSFVTESGFYSRSSVNQLSGNYSIDYTTSCIDISNFIGTEIAERGDGQQYLEGFNSIQSFSLQKDELRLYYKNNEKYFLFKSQESFMDYTIDAISCQWTNLKYDSKEVVIINSKNDVEKYTTCDGASFVDIDFSKYTLLVASGSTTSGIAGIRKQFTQEADNYNLDIDIALNMATIVPNWVVAILVSKMPKDAVISLNVYKHY